MQQATVLPNAQGTPKRCLRNQAFSFSWDVGDKIERFCLRIDQETLEECEAFV